MVFALPLRDDGKIYTGRVTFTASKPVEVEVLHVYNPAHEPDEEHGAPPAALINGTLITYSHLTGIVDNNYVLGDVSTASGTFEFTGSGLVFHKRSSEPFTLTYTIDAVVKPLTDECWRRGATSFFFKTAIVETIRHAYRYSSPQSPMLSKRLFDFLHTSSILLLSSLSSLKPNTRVLSSMWFDMPSRAPIITPATAGLSRI